MPPESKWVAVCLLADALIAWILLRRAGLRLPRLLGAGACSLAVAVAQGALAVREGRGFLAVAVGHAWLFFFVPATCAVLLLVAQRRGATRAARAALLAGLIVLPAVWAWTRFIEPFDLRLETAELALPAGRALDVPLRIGVLADLQCTEIGAHERQAVDVLMAQQPDLILIPGDLYSASAPAAREALRRPMQELLQQLVAPLGAFAVPGHCDDPVGLAAMIDGTPVRMLYDESVPLSWGGRTITLCGLRTWVWSKSARRHLATLEAPGDDVRLLLSHVPDSALQLPEDTRVDLVVAGHTHGGQVQLPFIGPPVIGSKVPREVGAGGLHELNGTRIYVSRGVGAERGDAPLIRFNCPPEVSLITLR